MPKSSILFVLLALIFSTSCEEAKTSDSEQKNAEKTTVNSENERFKMPALPDTVLFCGETVLIDNFDMEERLDKELIVNTYFHSSTVQIIKRAHRYFPMIEPILKEEGVPDDLKYLAVIESALSQATSRTGAKGFWQFMPAAATEHGLKMNREVEERYHIEKSTHAACVYLKRAQRKFDNWINTCASYNCGVGGLNQQIESQGTNDFFELYLNKETSRYIFRALALKLILENPEKYGFFPDEMELYEPVDVRYVEVDSSIPNLSVWARKNGSNLRMLKVLNPWLISNSLTVGSGSYQIALPK